MVWVWAVVALCFRMFWVAGEWRVTWFGGKWEWVSQEQVEEWKCVFSSQTYPFSVCKWCEGGHGGEEMRWRRKVERVAMWEDFEIMAMEKEEVLSCIHRLEFLFGCGCVAWLPSTTSSFFFSVLIQKFAIYPALWTMTKLLHDNTRCSDGSGNNGQTPWGGLSLGNVDKHLKWSAP